MLKTENQNGVLIVRLEDTDRLHALNAEKVKAGLNDIFTTPGTKLILDLIGIEFIDSTGFGVLLSAMKTAHQNQGKFLITGISEEVMGLFKLLQLHHVFDIYSSKEDALKSFN